MQMTRPGCDEAHLHLLISGEHVGHFPAVQQVVDVLNKGFTLDLSVTEEEHSALGFPSCPTQDALQVFSPLCLAIALGDLHLKQPNQMSVNAEGARRVLALRGGSIAC